MRASKQWQEDELSEVNYVYQVDKWLLKEEDVQ